MQEKPYITTLTSKGQFTVPKAVRRKLAVKPGTKFEVTPTRLGFTAVPKSESRILELAGSLSKYDDGKPRSYAIEQAKYLAALEIVKKRK
ncbi:MAG: AbrB/MazE/SpoVT family DNA-binding domain-containing protein [Patescibacteria group bacterium]